jgi:polyisoprenoid-binding protein YceI
METTWQIDSMHSEIGFKVKHMMITNVSGSFGDFTAHAITTGDHFNGSKLSFKATVDSISTGVADRDSHLKSDDFFNAQQFPELTFKSTSVEQTGDEIKVGGHMTIRDVTLPVTLTGEFAGIVTDPYGQTKAGLTLSGKIKRSDYGLKWSAITEAGSIVVSDEIRIHNEIQFVKQG